MNSILFLTDFSGLAINAGQIAKSLALSHSAKLFALNAIEPTYLITSADIPVQTPIVGQDLVLHAEDLMAEWAKDIRDQIEVETKVEIGFISQSAKDWSRIIKPDLIICGSHGVSGAREFFMGSTAYQIIKHSKIPVLSIPGNFPSKEIKKILYPIRPIEGEIEKFEILIQMHLSNNLEVNILELYHNYEEKEFADTNLSKLKVQLTRAGINFNIYATGGEDFAKEVLNWSKQLEVDAICINATLDYSWREFFIGPFTQRIVNHSTLPVLSLRY